MQRTRSLIFKNFFGLFRLLGHDKCIVPKLLCHKLGLHYILEKLNDVNMEIILRERLAV